MVGERMDGGGEDGGVRVGGRRKEWRWNGGTMVTD